MLKPQLVVDVPRERKAAPVGADSTWQFNSHEATESRHLDAWRVYKEISQTFVLGDCHGQTYRRNRRALRVVNECPRSPEWGGSTICFIGFWTVHDISRTFFDPLKPRMVPPGGTLIFLGSESEMIVKVVICFTVKPLYLKHASNHA